MTLIDAFLAGVFVGIFVYGSLFAYIIGKLDRPPSPSPKWEVPTSRTWHRSRQR